MNVFADLRPALRRGLVVTLLVALALFLARTASGQNAAGQRTIADNAEAVRFTFQRVLDPEQRSPNRATIAEIIRVDIVDDLTVNLVTRQPYAPLINRLLDFPMLPPKYTAEKGNQGMALRPVGTGPFRFVELIKDDRLVVEAFDRHWRGAPRVRRIIYKPIPEPFTRAAALRNNEVDLITTVPPSLARELERVSGIRVQRVPSTWIIYLGLNALKKPLSDVRVRQALNYATDADAIIKKRTDWDAVNADILKAIDEKYQERMPRVWSEVNQAIEAVAKRETSMTPTKVMPHFSITCREARLEGSVTATIRPSRSSPSPNSMEARAASVA